MTAATLTEATAAGKLLDELRELLARHDGAETLDEVRELADDVTAVLRRARGRIARLARKAAASKPAPAIKESLKPAAPAMPLPRPQDAPPLATYRRSPLDEAAGLQERKEQEYGDYQAAVLRAEIGDRAHEALTPVERPMPATTTPAPVPVALEDTVFLEERKRDSYRDYQRTVLRCEIGWRAFEALESPVRERTEPVRVTPQPRRVGTVRYVLAAVTVAARRAGRRITKAVRRMLAGGARWAT